ncbi:hypothetical protein HS088_TW17G01060 [Tripterygium wilfordii]|uniref:Wall-associated receptor kinase galacturonan-binding domain-containing protein n=1 Tax=Tripterygium wilfordii TaxID=458696 RepID=A0A7J7CHL6_TRIWF|nr:hypothetical protein HS088_TW17G01060 [Tripterygium wilfordii]
MLATTNKWFNSLIMQDSVWRYACLRDLQIPAPCHVEFKWSKLYASAFNCSHAYTFRQQEKHIDWMRIGAFSLNSRAAFLTKNLNGPLKISKEKTKEKMLEFCGSCVLENMKTGIWIADLQLVRCPVCDLNACDGTMQTLDARHIELFLKEGYQDGSWEYNLMGSHKIEKNVGEASAAIFDVKHLKDSSTAAIFDLKSWAGKPNDWQPKSLITFNAVAITTNLQENEVSVCHGDQIGIRFPFSLQGKQPQDCGYPGFNLSCNDQGVTVLNLPYSGDFLVRNINYHTQQIQVYDSNNCLAGRLLSLNLSGSPFSAAFYQNYTFLRCPTQLVTPRFTPINCLSNSTTSVLATSSMNLVNSMSTSCDIIDTLPTPVDLNDDLKLTWILRDCTDCETGGGICGFKNNTTQEIGCSYDSSSGRPKNGLEIFRLIALAIGVPIMIFVVFAVGFSLLAYLLDPGNRNSTPASTTRQPAVALTGLDESTIESYHKQRDTRMH